MYVDVPSIPAGTVGEGLDHVVFFILHRLCTYDYCLYLLTG